MSALFEVRVESVSGPIARIRFEVCHPDQHNVPATKTFALMAVLQAFEHGRTTTHAHRAPLEEFLVLARGRREEISEEELGRLERFETDVSAKLSGWGIEDGVRFKQFLPEQERLAVAASEVIEEVHLEDEDNNPRAGTDAPAPRATLVLTTADASWLTHLEAGLRWQSAHIAGDEAPSPESSAEESYCPNCGLVGEPVSGKCPDCAASWD